MSDCEKAFEEWVKPRKDNMYGEDYNRSADSWKACWKNHVEPLKYNIECMNSLGHEKIDRLEKENKRLRECVEFYANPEFWHGHLEITNYTGTPTWVEGDLGKKAIKCLEKLSGEEDWKEEQREKGNYYDPPDYKGKLNDE